MRKIILVMLLCGILIIGTVGAITFSNRDRAIEYKNKAKDIGDIRIKNVHELLDEYTEVEYEYDILFDDKVELTVTKLMKYETVANLKDIKMQELIREAVLKHAINDFETWKKTDQIIVTYDDMKGDYYDQRKKEWITNSGEKP